MRPISSTSRKPRVVMNPTGAPRCSTMALVTMVVPWASVAHGPVLGARATMPFKTPSAGLVGVVGTLHDSIRPAGSDATTSVNVPPTSTPIRTPSVMRLASPFPRCDHSREHHECVGRKLQVYRLALRQGNGGGLGHEHAQALAVAEPRRNLGERALVHEALDAGFHRARPGPGRQLHALRAYRELHIRSRPERRGRGHLHLEPRRQDHTVCRHGATAQDG